ncbi:Hypothetical predicted protein [Lecanosticta acicola]|uniref:Uncharacterized protein n=1 Tax=Lecanosticta acicola TaxID=111012 RepID=A0AAI8Z4P9_9PEZI|nr:Hypothetical predicted protein [Lecanosticta acicola]
MSALELKRPALPTGEEEPDAKTSSIANTLADADTALFHAHRAAHTKFVVHNACPRFELSNVVKQAWNMRNEHPLVQELTRLPDQVDAQNEVVHFVSTGEMIARYVLHYKIAWTLHKISSAERIIRQEKYTIVYAVSDAQLLLLMEHLRLPAQSFDVQTRARIDQKGKRHLKSIYIYKVMEEAIALAYQSLTGPCAIFQVRKWCTDEKRDKPYMAFAFFEELAIDAQVKFTIKILYQEMSYFQVLPAEGLVRA